MSVASSLIFYFCGPNSCMSPQSELEIKWIFDILKHGEKVTITLTERVNKWYIMRYKHPERWNGEIIQTTPMGWAGQGWRHFKQFQHE